MRTILRRFAGAALASIVTLALCFAALNPIDATAQRFVPAADPAYPKLKYSDSLTSLNDRCIVAQRKLSTTIRPVYVSGTPIGFCCSRCPNIFVNDPERYLKALDIEIPCTVDPVKRAILLPALRTQINHEIFFFSDAKARRGFLDDPLRYCGLVTDPVTRQRFQPTKESPKLTHGGRPYYFVSDSSRSIFEDLPVTYADRHGG